MSSERTIERLVSNLAPVRPTRSSRDATMLAGLCLAEIALFVLLGQARQDLGAATALPVFWWKLGAMAALSVVGVAAALRSFRPGDASRGGLRLFYAIAAAALVAGWGFDAAYADAGTVGARLMWREGVACVFAMVVLSLPPIIALALLMRRGAPVDRRASALAAGLASAAWGASVFTLNCPHDDPLYVAVWYSAGCALIALAARLILPRIGRW